MGCNITSERVPSAVAVSMSNARMSVVLEVLSLAACDRATTDWERRLAYWIVQHDHSRSGTHDLDICELGWTLDDFIDQQRFVLAVVDAAIAHHAWDRLPFTPGELVDAALAELRVLVATFPREAALPAPEDWVPDELPEHGTCDRHRVFLHELGCIVCNNAPIG